MSRIGAVSTFIAAAFACHAAVAQAQVIPGTSDNFNNGTTQGWFAGLGGFNPNAPRVLPGGGPGGASDPFMLLRASGREGSPGGRLSAMNASQWAGNYLAASIVGISMRVNNLGFSNLFLRMAFEDPTTGPPANLAYSTNAVFVGARSGWQQIFFPIVPSALTAGIGSVDAALMNTTVVRLYHSQAANFPNPIASIPAMEATLGVDDIAAVVVPEPASLLLLATGGLGVIAAHRRRRRGE